MANEEDYFIAANSVGAINEEQYKKLDVLIHTTEAISRSLYQSVYLIDYYKKGFHPTHFQHRYDCLLGQAERLIIGECNDAPDKKLYENILKKAEKKGIKTSTI